MTLLVDIGNSAVKWARWSEGKPAASNQALYEPDQIESLLSERWAALDPPRRVLVASVAAPAMETALAQWCERHWDVRPVFVRARAEGWGVINAYPQPERLGADRWAALVAARDAATGPAVVVDCGSAVTVDVLAGDGMHLGGLIVPGIGRMQHSLEQLPGVTLEAAGSRPGEMALLARNTHDAVSGGTLYAVVAFVDRVSADVSSALEAFPERLITGGDAGRVLGLLRDSYQHRPDLVLEGLAVVAGDFS